MQHAEAIRSQASEKYLLDELTPREREEFEEHFFGCPECALDVRSGHALVEHSKIALAELAPARQLAPASPRQPGRSTSWLWPAFVVPVMALLLLVIGYENVVLLPKVRGELADLQTPRILASTSLLNARSDRIPSVTIRHNQPFLLFVDIPSDSRFSSYACELYTTSGARAWSLSVTREAARNTVPLEIPSTRMPSGRYFVVVSGIADGQNLAELARYPFDLQVQP